MGLFGLVFVLVVTGQLVVAMPGWSRVFAVAGWVLWAVFVAELGLRAYIARDQRQFWRGNWWQLVFLAVPFLRFARALRLLRTARIGGVLSATVRGSRSAGRLLSGRIASLAVLTGAVVLVASQLLYATETYTHYGEALHEAALPTVTGEPLTANGALARVAEVLLAIYSMAVRRTGMRLDQHRSSSIAGSPMPLKGGLRCRVG
jgi:voltage-gated potassium channel